MINKLYQNDILIYYHKYTVIKAASISSCV